MNEYFVAEGSDFFRFSTRQNGISFTQSFELGRNSDSDGFLCVFNEFFVSECVISRRFPVLECQIDNQRFCHVVERFLNDDFSLSQDEMTLLRFLKVNLKIQ